MIIKNGSVVAIAKTYTDYDGDTYASNKVIGIYLKHSSDIYVRIKSSYPDDLPNFLREDEVLVLKQDIYLSEDKIIPSTYNKYAVIRLYTKYDTLSLCMTDESSKEFYSSVTSGTIRNDMSNSEFNNCRDSLIIEVAVSDNDLNTVYKYFKSTDVFIGNRDKISIGNIVVVDPNEIGVITRLIKLHNDGKIITNPRSSIMKVIEDSSLSYELCNNLDIIRKDGVIW